MQKENGMRTIVIDHQYTHHCSDRGSPAGAAEAEGHEEVGLPLGHEEQGWIIGGVASVLPCPEKRL